MRVPIARPFLLIPFMLLLACSSKDAASDKTSLELVSPDDAYGKTYADWAATWVQYVSSASPPDCNQPLMDETGESCALNQDDASDVFFLVGNYAGVSVRDKCKAPASKALFFPLINVWGDNAGVPADMLLSDSDIKAYMKSKFNDMDSSSLKLSVDGTTVPNLASGAVPVAPYTLELAPMANVYVCNGSSDVQGEFPGYLSGYWAMLPPLSAGQHHLEFGGTAKGSTSMDMQTVDQTYELTVE